MNGRAGRGFRWLFSLGIASLVASPAAAQTALSPLVSVALSATKPGALTVTPTANGTQSIGSIADGTTTEFGPGPVGITTQWDVKPGQTSSIRLIGYFVSATAALTDGAGTNIPSSEVEAMMSTVPGMTWTPFSGAALVAGAQTFGTSGATITFWEVPISGLNKKSSRTDALALRLNLTGRAVPLPAGTYAGTLYLRAIAF